MVISPLAGHYRAFRTIQAPDHVVEAPDRPEGFRVSSAAFKPGTDKSISVDLEESMISCDVDPETWQPALPRSVAMVTHLVSRYTEANCTVAHIPIVENPHHGEVRFADLTKSERRDLARSLADNCNFVVSIDASEARKQIQLRASAARTVLQTSP